MGKRGVPSGGLGAAAVLVVLAVFLPAAIRAGEGPARLRVIATLFPQYDFARRIAGGRAEVRLLLPPGAESHSYEPTPGDMMDIARADLLIYTGPHMEPWAARLAEAGSQPGGVSLVDASRGIGGRDRPAPAHANGAAEQVFTGPDGHEAGHYHDFDPHIWLDPLYAVRMVDTIAAAMAERDPEGAATYRANAQALRAELEALDAEFREIAASSPNRTLVFGERFAFGHFFERYGLEEIGPYASCGPGAEPGLKAVLEVLDFMKEHGVRIIYQEAQSPGRISAVLVEETGARILTVDSLHTPPVGHEDGGYSYLGVMRANMAAFARGLE